MSASFKAGSLVTCHFGVWLREGVRADLDAGSMSVEIFAANVLTSIVGNLTSDATGEYTVAFTSPVTDVSGLDYDVRLAGTVDGHPVSNRKNAGTVFADADTTLDAISAKLDSLLDLATNTSSGTSSVCCNYSDIVARIPSLLELEYSFRFRAMLKTPVIDDESKKEHLQICDDDAVAGVPMQGYFASAISIIEKETGLVIAPKLVEVMVYGPNGICNVPLPFGPVWTQDQMDSFIAAPSTPEAILFASALTTALVNSKPVYTTQGDTILTSEVDTVRQPPSASLSSSVASNSPIRIFYVCGYPDLAAIECECPELIQAIVMTATDFYEQYSMEDICKRQRPFWDMLGFRV